MPEKMTKEEAIIAMAIKKAREAKSMLHESTQIMPYDHEVEVVKIKRPKAQNVKIKNQTQKKEGYGLAGETLKKAKFSGPSEQFPYAGAVGKLDTGIYLIDMFIKDKKTLDEGQVKKLKEYVKEAMQDLDELDKYKKIRRKDEKYLRVKD